MQSKITLAPWPQAVPAAKTVSVESLQIQAPDLTSAERVRVLDCLQYLRVNYRLGLNRLMRASGLYTDLKSIFEKRKKVEASVVDTIAATLGLSTPELWAIESLSLERTKELHAYLIEQSLTEPLRGSLLKSW